MKKVFDKYNKIIFVLLLIQIVFWGISLSDIHVPFAIGRIEPIFVIVFFICLLLSVIRLVYSIVKKQRKLMIIPIISLIIYIACFAYIIYFQINPLYESMNHSDMDLKPMIYFYPKEKIDLTIKLEHDDLAINTYPEYKNEWNITVDESGNIYDKKTNRNYYALYYDAYDNTRIDESIGFVVYKDNLVNFLEEKLEYIGLNEREINEFIVYWLPVLNKNEYNYIYFRTTEEVNDYMKLNFSSEPDALIRVFMDFKKASKNTKVQEQVLPHYKRNGFTVVEWGGRNISNNILK